MIRVGTSGWSYEHWFGKFYPDKLARQKELDFYKTKFDTVELNVSFYRLVPQKTYAKWHDEVDDNFLFTIKASRYLTHIKRLKNYYEPLEKFFQTLKPLKSNIGPILFQLPASFKKDSESLKVFVEDLPVYYDYAFEFRDISWFSDDIYQILQDNNISLVLSVSPTFPFEEVITADFTYIRFHGPQKLYGSNFSEQELEQWAEKIKRWSSKEITTYAYFNNDFNAYAPLNALRLKEILEESLGERAA